MSEVRPILGKAISQPTQVRQPLRTVARSVFQGVVGLAPILPLAYEAATHHDAAAATGWVGAGLAVSGAVVRVMAVPAVNVWIARFLPFLAPEDPRRILGKA